MRDVTGCHSVGSIRAPQSVHCIAEGEPSLDCSVAVSLGSGIYLRLGDGDLSRSIGFLGVLVRLFRRFVTVSLVRDGIRLFFLSSYVYCAVRVHDDLAAGQWE